MRAKDVWICFCSAAEQMVLSARLAQAAERLEPLVAGVKGRRAPFRSPQKMPGWVRTLHRDAAALQEVPRDLCREGFGGLNQALLWRGGLYNGARLSLVSDRHLPGFGGLGWAVVREDGGLSRHPDFAPGRGNEEHLLEFLERVEALTPEEVKHLFG